VHISDVNLHTEN